MTSTNKAFTDLSVCDLQCYIDIVNINMFISWTEVTFFLVSSCCSLISFLVYFHKKPFFLLPVAVTISYLAQFIGYCLKSKVDLRTTRIFLFEQLVHSSLWCRNWIYFSWSRSKKQTTWPPQIWKRREAFIGIIDLPCGHSG